MNESESERIVKEGRTREALQIRTFTVELTVDLKLSVSVAISYFDPVKIFVPPSKIRELFLYTKLSFQRSALLVSWKGGSSIQAHRRRDEM